MEKFSLEWLGQAGYILRVGDKTLAIDPYCSDVPCAKGAVRLYPGLIPKNGLEADYVFATHDHGDHLDIETLRSHIASKVLVAPPSCIHHAIEAEGLPMEAVPIERGLELNFGEFKVRGMFARHVMADDAVGLLFEAKGRKIYISGDTLYEDGLEEVVASRPDIMCICINGKFGNMNYIEAEELAKRARPKLAIPMHYDTILHNTENPDLFVEDLLEAGVPARTLERGTVYDVETLIKEAERGG